MFGTVRNGFCELFVCFVNSHPPGPGSATWQFYFRIGPREWVITQGIVKNIQDNCRKSAMRCVCGVLCSMHFPDLARLHNDRLSATVSSPCSHRRRMRSI